MEDFPLASKQTGRRKNKCKKCTSEHYFKYKDENSELVRDKWRRSSRKYANTDGKRRKRLKQYGLTIEDYNTLFEEQNGRCKICSKELKLCVDHCHKSSKVRGLLCNSCNVGLGCFEDNIERLEIAIKYLKCGEERFPDRAHIPTLSVSITDPATQIGRNNRT